MFRKMEEELEDLRCLLYHCVGGLPSKLADSSVLPISKLLDDLILEVQKAKNKLN